MNIAEYNTYIEKYLKMVYRISFHYFGNRDDAENLFLQYLYELETEIHNL